MRRFLLLALFMMPLLSFSVEIALYVTVDCCNPKVLVAEIEKIPGISVINEEYFKTKIENVLKKKNDYTLMDIIFASRILKIRYVVFVTEKSGTFQVYLIDSYSKSTKKLFVTSNAENVVDMVVKRLKDIFYKTDELSLFSFSIPKWKKGFLYKQGDIVVKDGKVFKSLLNHISCDENSPENDNGKFWKLSSNKIVAVYFPSWGIYSKSFTPLDVDGDSITHLIYAFANISDEGVCIVGDPVADYKNFKELVELKKKYPHLKILISVDGWNWSENFSKVALTEKSRERFVDSCIRKFIEGDFGKHGKYPDLFDGIDIDWEYPTGGGKYPGLPEDRRNFTLLMKKFREKLDDLSKKTGKRYLLAFAGGAHPEYIFKKVEMDKVSKYVDFIVVMTYDFNGSWSELTGFHNNLYEAPEDLTRVSYNLNVDRVIKNYIKAGAPKEKLLLGIPFYGRSWSGVKDENNGLFQPFSGVGPGTVEGGVVDYPDVVHRFQPVMKRFFHPEAQAVWLYGDGVFITYESTETATLKALYVIEEDLGGITVWEITMDQGCSCSGRFSTTNVK